jgi:hypothetical protein
VAHRHKRETRPRRTLKAALVAGPIALLTTGTAVAYGVAQQPGPVEDLLASQEPSATSSRDASAASRSESRLSEVRGEQYVQQLQNAYLARQAAREKAREKAQAEARAAARAAARKEARATAVAIRAADEHLWTTAPLNLWSGPDADAEQVGLVDEGEKVLVTGRDSGDRAELVVDGEARWVTASYLSEDKPAADRPADGSSATPAPSAPAGLSSQPCPDGSVENGLTAEAVTVYRAVCNAFPQVETYLGYDAHGEHASGQAIDIMTSDKALGDQIASFLQSHAAELDLYDVIWWDRIWTPVRASEGWRDYGDHGSPTANHMDHVHVSTNG